MRGDLAAIAAEMPKLVVLEQSLPAVAGVRTTSWTSPGRCTAPPGGWAVGATASPSATAADLRVHSVKGPALLAVDEDAAVVRDVERGARRSLRAALRG